MKLHLACGGNHLDGYENVDVSPSSKADKLVDLLDFPLPWKDNSVDEIRCDHFIEHIPHQMPGQSRDAFILFMEECYRILKPKGKMLLTYPHPNGEMMWADPTHCRTICPRTFGYFSKEWRDVNIGNVYDIKTDFLMVSSSLQLACPADTPEDRKQLMATTMANAVTNCETVLEANKPDAC